MDNAIATAKLGDAALEAVIGAGRIDDAWNATKDACNSPSTPIGVAQPIACIFAAAKGFMKSDADVVRSVRDVLRAITPI